MKKIIALAIAAILTLTVFTGCQYTADYNAKNVSGISVSMTGQWAGPTILVDKSWEKLTFEFASQPSAMQFVLQSDATYEESWGTAHRCNYKSIDGTKVELDLAAILTELKEKFSDTTALYAVQLQNTGTSNSCFLTSVTYTKDGTESKATFQDPQSWEAFTLTVIE